MSNLCVLELLLDVLDGRLAVEADKGPADQLRMDGVGAHDLTHYPHQRANQSRRQTSNTTAAQHQKSHTPYQIITYNVKQL